MTMPTPDLQSNSSNMITSIFIPIDLEASLGRIEDDSASGRRQSANQEQPSWSSSPSTEQDSTENSQTPQSHCSRSGITRTSSRTPFATASSNEKGNNTSGSSSLLKPYPISETDAEIKERRRLSESVDWSNGLVVNSPPMSSVNDADQQSMMEVTVDDFVLSAEEAGSLTDLDATTIQDDDFWETPVQVAKTLAIDSNDVDMMATVPFSVTFSSQDSCIDDIDDDADLTDAAPIRSIDMEW